jgi:thiamine-monophosphate kinase
VTVFGEVPAVSALRRDAALPGDDLWVSGPLGGAAGAVAARHAGAAVDPAAAARLDWPRPRLRLGQALRGVARAAIDLSDGLAGDLGHILAASSTRCGQLLGADLVAESIPVDPTLAALEAERALALALHGGDDYELLFAADPARRERIAALDPGDGFDAGPPRRIGTVVVGTAIRLLAAGSAPRAIVAAGFDHFAR